MYSVYITDTENDISVNESMSNIDPFFFFFFLIIVKLSVKLTDAI